MPNPRLASRYAKSLIDLANERGQLELVYQDMLWLKEVCKSSKEFANVLRSPIIKADTKLKIVQSVTGNTLGELSNAFIRLLVSKGREGNLPEIAAAVVEQYNEIKNIHRVKLVTATPASEELKQAIIKKVKADAALQNVELETEVNDAIIGGFQLEYKGNLVDASIARDLRDIQTQFQKNTYIRNIR